MDAHPRQPTRTSELRPGELWSLPLSDGRFGCGRVLRLARATERTTFVAGVMDWVGTEPPTAASIAGAKLLGAGYAHIEALREAQSPLLGHRPLAADRLRAPREPSEWWPCWGPRDLAESLLAKAPVVDAWERVEGPLTNTRWRALAKKLGRHPSPRLSVSGLHLKDVEFLRHFPFLDGFEVHAHRRIDVTGLAHLPAELDELVIGAPVDASVAPLLAQLKSLRVLHLEGPVADLSFLRGLPRLEVLVLRSMRPGDLDALRGLTRLRALALRLGSLEKLDALTELPRLRALELGRVRGVRSLAKLAGVHRLEALFVHALGSVDRLPDLSTTRLRHLDLLSLPRVRSLAPLVPVRSLAHLSVARMRLRPADFAPLAAHPGLRSVNAFLGDRAMLDVRDLVERPLDLRAPRTWADWVAREVSRGASRRPPPASR